jgi:hypothetical protein
LRRSSRPSSGNSVIRVQAMVGPTPGTEAMRSSFSRQVGEPRAASSMSVSRLESSFCSAASRRAMLFCKRFSVRGLLPLALGDDHLDDLSASSDKIGQKRSRVCLVGHRPDVRFGSRKWAVTTASIGWVLARFPSPWQRRAPHAGLTTTTGRPAAERLAATTVS